MHLFSSIRPSFGLEIIKYKKSAFTGLSAFDLLFILYKLNPGLLELLASFFDSWCLNKK
jgi:hypothetical protein